MSRGTQSQNPSGWATARHHGNHWEALTDGPRHWWIRTAWRLKISHFLMNICDNIFLHSFLKWFSTSSQGRNTIETPVSKWHQKLLPVTKQLSLSCRAAKSDLWPAVDTSHESRCECEDSRRIQRRRECVCEDKAAECVCVCEWVTDELKRSYHLSDTHSCSGKTHTRG